MAKIYDAQIQWQSPSGHRFQAQPLEDYISAGLAEVSKAAGQASEGIQRLHDIDATERMKQAGVEAANYIDNFEDFSGDNYMEKMQANAMQIWDDAYSQLDEPTKRRFEMNNPKARDIFEFTVSKSAVEKTFNHQATQYTRQIPSIANQIVELKDPNLIKKALQEKVFELTEKSGMRADDAEKVVDTLQLTVAEGAIRQAIGEGRLSDAAALNNDLEFAFPLTPDKRAQNNVLIQNALNEKEKEKKALTEDKKRQAVVDALSLSSVHLYDEMYARAGMDTAAREEVTVQYNKFLSDFLNGNIRDEYAGIPLAEYFPDLKLYTDAPFSVRQAAVKKIVGETLENNPTDKKIKADLGYRVANLAASVPNNEDGYADLQKITPEKIADIATVLGQVKNYYSFDDSVQKNIDKLSQMYVSWTDRAAAALEHSKYQDENTLVSERTGLGWRTQRYLQSGNLAPDEIDALRTGKIKDTQGLHFSPEYKAAMDAAMENFAYWTNNGKLPDPGTYRYMLMAEICALYYMSDADKKALGIENATREQFLQVYLEKVKNFSDMGILDSEVSDDVNTAPTGLSMDGVVWTNIGAPIKETDYFKSMLSTVKALNRGAMPDEELLSSYAAANRSTAYKDNIDKFHASANPLNPGFTRFTRSATHADKDTRAYEAPYSAGAANIRVNNNQ